MEFSSEITKNTLLLNKEECVKTVQQMFGQKLLKSDTGGLCTWTVPTSIFIGFRPLNITTCEQHFVDSKRRPTVEVNILNTVEKRQQTESLREDKFSGVVFRGNGMYGWASRKLQELIEGWEDTHFEAIDFDRKRETEYKGMIVGNTEHESSFFWQKCIELLRGHVQRFSSKNTTVFA